MVQTASFLGSVFDFLINWKQFKVSVRATLQQHRLTPTAPSLDLLGIAGLRRKTNAKMLVLVCRCLQDLTTLLPKTLFRRATSGDTHDRHCTTCGQASNLLHVPFILGSACHAFIVFQRSLLWNSLLAKARAKRMFQAFKNYLRNTAPNPSIY